MTHTTHDRNWKAKRWVAFAAGLALGTLVLTMSARPALAQGGQPGGDAKARVSAPQADAKVKAASPFDDDAVIVNVTFKGGTLREFVDAVRANLKTIHKEFDVNMIFQGGTDAVRVPAISLTNVTMRTAFRALEPVAIGEGGGRLAIRVVREGAGEPVYVAELENQPSPRGSVAVGTKVFSLRDVIVGKVEGDEQAAAERVLSTLEAALAVEGEGKAAPVVRFHKETRILIVRGTAAQIDVVQSVLATLREDAAKQDAEVDMSFINAITNAEADVNVARITLSRNETNLEEAKKYLRSMSELHEKGQASTQDLRFATDGVAQAEFEVRRATIEVERTNKVLEAMKAHRVYPAVSPNNQFNKNQFSAPAPGWMPGQPPRQPGGK